MPNKQKSINTFSKGMNKDLDLSVIPKDSYLHAENFRLITDEGSTTTSLEVVDGNVLQNNFVLSSGYEIVGYTSIRNQIVFFTTNNIYSIIYSCDIENGVYTNFTIVYDDNLSPDGSRIGLSTTRKVKAIGRYESSGIIKVYWTDNYNKLRFINIADPDIQTYSVNKFEIIPAHIQRSISIDSIGIGVLDTGAVQYSYQLYNLYGAETSYTSPSFLTILGEYKTTGSDVLFTGSDVDDNSGKSITFSISNIDTTFNRIRIVRIFYKTLVDEPTITIIYENSLTSSMSFTDNGISNLGELTLEEFIFINYDFICKEIETKDNILFAANVQENIWDVDYDTRAYRFNSDSYAYVANFNTPMSNPEGVYEIVSLPDDYNIPENHDVWNPFNDFTLDGVTMNGIFGDKYFKYKSDGITLGGEGLNISYNFTFKDIVLNNTESTCIETSSNSLSWVNPKSVSENRGYQRDEIYPFAIVLWNTRGQKSYPLWIGDIRFPRIQDSPIYNIVSNTSGTPGRVLGIDFTVTNLPADCTHWQIVRCERKLEDRTILAQGLIGATRIYTEGSSWNCPSITLPSIREYNTTVRPGLVLDKRLLEFMSPEISYNKNLDFQGGDVLELVEYLALNKRYYKNRLNTSSFVNNIDLDYGATEFIVPFSGDIKIVISNVTSATSHFSSIKRNNINDFKIVDKLEDTDNVVPPSFLTTIGSNDYENYIRKYGSPNIQGYCGTTGVIEIDSDLDISGVVDTTGIYGSKFVLANYKRAISGYGGGSYSSRSRRYYIPVSDPTVGEVTVSLYNGDTFVSLFDYQRAMVSGLIGTVEVEEYLNEVFRFPVETSINIRWQSNRTFSQLYSNTSNGVIDVNKVLIQEKAGVHAKSKLGFSGVFTQTEDLYKYNSVYSKQPDIIKYFAKPIDLNENKIFDSRVINSDKKINGENSDSWTKFRVNNFIDVDSKYGGINSLLLYNTYLLYWQDKAFGMLSVNQRSLLQDNNPGVLTLGTGGILDRFDYISTDVGNMSQFGIMQGKDGVYWFDTLNNTFYKYNGQTNPLSKLKGIQSYLNNFSDKSTLCIGAYDNKFNEVIFTLTNSVPTQFTISYNEMIDAFISIYSFNPSIYIQAYDNTFSTSEDNNTLYLHNNGDKATFYETIYKSNIRFVVNDNYSTTKVFDSIEFSTKSLNGNVELFDDTFDNLVVYNDKQITGDLSNNDTNIINGINMTKREGSFSVIISRNIIDSNITSNVDIFDSGNYNYSRQFKERIRGKYAIINLNYRNDNWYKFSCPYIITNYRISYR